MPISENEDMAGTCANTEILWDPEEMRELLAEVDAFSASEQGRWAEKRDSDRRKIKTDCSIRYLGPDGQRVLTTSGRTRDISVGGLGFICPKHFLKNAPLLVTLILPDGQVKRMTGEVVYSRQVRQGWYLTGLKFSRLKDVRLLGETPAPASSKAKPADKSTGQRKHKTEPAPRPEPATARDRTLQMLAAVTTVRKPSRATVFNVVKMTMSPDHVIRQATIPVLMHIKGQEAILSLINFLEDPNPHVRGEAAEALGMMRATEAVDHLKKLLRDKSQEVGLHAAVGLFELGDKSGLLLIGSVLRSDSELNRRAARALGIIVGQKFRPNAEGVKAARRYAKSHGI